MLEKEAQAETIDEEDNENDLPGNEMSTSKINEEAIQQKLKQIKDKGRKKATGLFHKKSASRMDAIHKRHPDIGEVMEKIVAEADIGADKWQ